MHLNLLGQALIRSDLRAAPWPGLAELAAMLARADLCFSDLETAIRSPSAEAPTRDGVFLHAADPAVLDCLDDLSVRLLATANNHVWDLGSGGVVGMLDELDRRDLTHAGAGADLAAAVAPAYRTTVGGTVALVAAASGAVRPGAAASPTRAGINELRRGSDGRLHPADLARILAAIAEAAGNADIVLAYHHNHLLDGAGRQTPRWQRDFAHLCLEAGASLYASHGAPRLHGIEIYRGRPIFYDLGNLIFQTATAEGHYDDAAWQSVVAECRFAGGQFQQMTLTPLQLNSRGLGGAGDLATRGRPSIAKGAGAGAILDRLIELSKPFGTAIEREGDTAILRARP